MGGVHLVPILEDLEDHRGAAEGDEESGEDRFVDGEPKFDADEGGRKKGYGDLEGPPHQGRPSDPQEPLEGELDADGEEEEDDPHLGEELYLLHLVDEPEAVGAGDDPRHQEPHHHRDPKPRPYEDGDDRDEEDDYDVVEDGYGHPSAHHHHPR